MTERDNIQQQLLCWREDLNSLKRRMAHADSQFEFTFYYLMRITVAAENSNNIKLQQKRCIEKMRTYRSDLLTIMIEVGLLVKQFKHTSYNHNQQWSITLLCIPAQPLFWYWSGSIYNGIQRLTDLLNQLGSLSEQLGKQLTNIEEIIRSRALEIRLKQSQVKRAEIISS